MSSDDPIRPGALFATTASVVLTVSALLGQQPGPQPVTVGVGDSPEQIVFVRSDDDVVSGGVLFAPPSKQSVRGIAVIWIHGWGANFYQPSYVAIGRALAQRGLTTIVANTRMHDIANVQQYRGGKRIRGGGYWGIPSEQARDIAAWIRFAEKQGFTRIVLVGHSAGWAAVRAYQAETRDPRTAGLVFASGQVQPPAGGPDQQLLEQLAQASQFVKEGRGDDLLRIPNRSFPSFISAATFFDDFNTPLEIADFFGVRVTNPAITKVSCPILAFFGTRGDVGTESDLRLLKSAAERHSRRVDTAMIAGADHMYTSEEARVSQVISDWIDGAVIVKSVGRQADNARAADVTGRWTVTISLPNERMTGVALLTQTGDQVTGSIGPDERNQHPLDGVVNGNAVILTTHPSPGRTVAFAKCSLTVDGDKMTGTTDGGDFGDKAISIEFVRPKQ